EDLDHDGWHARRDRARHADNSISRSGSAGDRYLLLDHDGAGRDRLRGCRPCRAGAIAGWFGGPRVAEVLPVVSLVLPITACRIVSGGLLRKRVFLHRVSQTEIISGRVTL